MLNSTNQISMENCILWKKQTFMENCIANFHGKLHYKGMPLLDQLLILQVENMQFHGKLHYKGMPHASSTSGEHARSHATERCILIIDTTRRKHARSHSSITITFEVRWTIRGEVNKSNVACSFYFIWTSNPTWQWFPSRTIRFRFLRAVIVKKAKNKIYRIKPISVTLQHPYWSLRYTKLPNL